MAVELLHQTDSYHGLSTDTKPTPELPGATFLELDTHEFFRYSTTHGWQHNEPHVVIEAPHSSYGDLAVAELTPIVQESFAYSVNARLMESLVAGSGANTVSGSLLTCSSGTTTASDALLTSIKEAKHHEGQGNIGRFDAIFQSSGTAGTSAWIGPGNQEDKLAFGYNGSAFSILHRYGGKREFRTLTFTTGAVTASGTITITLDDDATTVEVVQNDSVQAVARAVGAVAFAGWKTQVIGADVVFISHLAEAKAGAFTFADTDTTGVVATAGLVQSITGVAPTEHIIAQTAWNQDTMDGGKDADNPSGLTLDVATGNAYEVQYQGGFGAIIYSVEHPDTGKPIHVHTMAWGNANTVVELQNPTLPIGCEVKNGGTTTDIVLKTSTMSIATEGHIEELAEGIANSTAATLSGDLTTETAIFALKSKPIFQSVPNRVEFVPRRLSVSGNGAGAAKFTTIRIRLNPILGGDPSFSDIDTATSIVAVDVAGTTVSGGAVLETFDFPADFEAIIELINHIQDLPPGALLVVTAEIDGGTSDVDAGIGWRELF